MGFPQGFNIKEPVSGFSHLLAGLVGIVGAGYLVWRNYGVKPPLHVLALAVFGVTLVMLFFSSAIFHLSVVEQKMETFLMKLDHTMIFVFIAGTYTPFCVIAFGGFTGKFLLAVVWSLALIGFLLKTLRSSTPVWISTGFYLFFGWLSVAYLPSFLRVLGIPGTSLLVAGGLAYTIGAIVHATEKPNPLPPWLGFHEIWHLLVIIGSACHFVVITHYL